jgi:tetratricopeptide (TPR) repeat protein
MDGSSAMRDDRQVTDDDWHASLANLRATGRYREARDLASLAVLDLELAGPSLELALALTALGRQCEDLGDYPAATLAYDRAIRCAESTSGAVAALGEALGRAAMLAVSEGRHQAAVAQAGRALHVVETESDLPRLIAASVLASVGLVQLDADGVDQAATLTERARTALAASPAGPERDEIEVRVLEADGIVNRAAGRYADAERILNEALERAELVFGRDSLEVAGILNGLGMNWKFSGRFDDAAPVYRRALAILKASVGEDHPDVASLYHNLGGLEHARGDFAAAEPYARRSVEIRARLLGGDHSQTWMDRAALAAVVDGLGRSDEAETLLRGAIDHLARSLGPDHVELAVNLNNLAAIRQRRGAPDEAEALYRRALAIKERALGPGSPLLATTLNNLATVVRRQGRPREAEALYRRALDLLEANLEASHPTLVTTRANLARLVEARERQQ